MGFLSKRSDGELATLFMFYLVKKNKHVYITYTLLAEICMQY